MQLNALFNKSIIDIPEGKEEEWPGANGYPMHP